MVQARLPGPSIHVVVGTVTCQIPVEMHIWLAPWTYRSSSALKGCFKHALFQMGSVALGRKASSEIFLVQDIPIGRTSLLGQEILE